MKAEHQRLARSLQPLAIPEWKWEHLTDFVTGLPRTLGGGGGGGGGGVIMQFR